MVSALPSACGPCGSNEEAIALARGLSQERLARLHRDVEALGLGSPAMVFLKAEDVPPAFDDLHPVSIVLDGHAARIHLAGCIDDKVLLLVRGPNREGRREITLLPGETKDSVALWRSP